MPHKPVLLDETLKLLALQPGEIVIDGTVGNAGHAKKMVEAVGAHGRLIGLDQDPASISKSQEILRDFPQVSLHHENFVNLENILAFLNIPAVNAVLLDVGLSSEQVEDSARGFSFNRLGPLDMRMNPEGAVRARDLVNDLSERELERIFREYANEWRAERFAKAIGEARRRKPLETTEDLIAVIEGALPRYFSVRKGSRPTRARRHPATRVFQALRIAVNDELGCLERGLRKIWGCLRPGGRLAVITFHSLEDRIVKYFFRELKQNGEGTVRTKKPVRPTLEEIRENPRARSAKLRLMEKRYERYR